MHGGLADLDGVFDRLDLLGMCTPDDMIELCREYERPLILVDIEGGQADFMMRPEKTTLVHVDLIIECHDGKREDASKVVPDRLAETHKIRLKGGGPRDTNAQAFLQKMSQIGRCLFTWEGRGICCYWLGAVSKSAICKPSNSLPFCLPKISARLKASRNCRVINTILSLIRGLV